MARFVDTRRFVMLSFGECRVCTRDLRLLSSSSPLTELKSGMRQRKIMDRSMIEVHHGKLTKGLPFLTLN